MIFDNVSLQNEELISASESGDVMTVVSLLNSGADVQTENKVYTLIFFSHLSSFAHLNHHMALTLVFHVNRCHIVEF